MPDQPLMELELVFDVFWHGATAIRVPQRQSLLDLLNNIVGRIITLESRPSTRAEPSAVDMTLEEFVRDLGRVENTNTHEQRRIVIEGHLKSNDAYIRDAAGLALADMNDPASIPALREAIATEACDTLRKDLTMVFEQLEATAKVPTPPDSSMRERAEKWATRMIRDDTVVGSHHEKLQRLSAGGQGEISTRSRREYIADALIAFASAEMEKAVAEHAQKYDDAILTAQLSTLTAERDALQKQLRESEIRAAALTGAFPPPPTQGDESDEQWARRRWAELNHNYTSAEAVGGAAIWLAREAAARATDAQRRRDAEIVSTGCAYLRDIGEARDAFVQAILTPSEQSK